MIWTHFKNEERTPKKSFEHENKRKMPKKEMGIKMGTWEQQVRKDDIQKIQYGKKLRRMKYVKTEMKRLGC
jgi:hypothetical protein